MTIERALTLGLSIIILFMGIFLIGNIEIHFNKLWLVILGIIFCVISIYGFYLLFRTIEM